MIQLMYIYTKCNGDITSPFHRGKLSIRAKLADRKFASRQSASLVSIKRSKLGNSLPKNDRELFVGSQQWLTIWIAQDP